MICFGSTVDPYNSYCSLTSYEKDVMIVPTIVGWKYIPRTKTEDQKEEEE